MLQSVWIFLSHVAFILQTWKIFILLGLFNLTMQITVMEAIVHKAAQEIRPNVSTYAGIFVLNSILETI